MRLSRRARRSRSAHLEPRFEHSCAELHVLIVDVPPSASDAVLQRLNTMLAERFHISHTTVQFEHAGCAISENGCAIPAQMESHEGTRTSMIGRGSDSSAAALLPAS